MYLNHLETEGDQTWYEDTALKNNKVNNPLTFTKIHEFQVCNKKLSHYISSILMKFIVTYG